MKTLLVVSLFIMSLSIIKLTNQNENKSMNLKNPDLIFSKIEQGNSNLLVQDIKQKVRISKIKYKTSTIKLSRY